MDRPLDDSEWLHFEDLPKFAKKRRIVVTSKKWGHHLGDIRWYGRWRQYVFEPAPATLFNAGCLRDLADRLAYLRQEERSSEEF